MTKFKCQSPSIEKIPSLSFEKSPHPPSVSSRTDFAKGGRGGIINFRQFADGETAAGVPIELWS
jgi:hypothetical protein